jgi:hypothetical protein
MTLIGYAERVCRPSLRLGLDSNRGMVLTALRIARVVKASFHSPRNQSFENATKKGRYCRTGLFL